MKRFKKLVSIMLAAVMTLAMTLPVMAANATTGKITVAGSTDVPVAGKTFAVYKILDAQLVGESGVTYRVPQNMENFFTSYFTDLTTTPDDNGFHEEVTSKISAWTQDSPQIQEFAKKALKYIQDNNIAAVDEKTAAANATTVEFDGLDYGYYLVQDTAVITDEDGSEIPVSAVILDTTTPDATVNIKASRPTIEKKIESGNELVDTNNAAIGSTVQYVLSSNVPDMRGYNKYFYIVRDTLSKGLTFNADSVSIKVGDTQLTKDTDYTVTQEPAVADGGPTAVKIVFKNFIQYNDRTGEKIEIRYTATVNNGAVIGVAGNPNEVTLEYSTNPTVSNNGTPGNSDEPGPGDVTGETPKDVTKTFVTGIQLTKKNGSNELLAGATFTISGNKIEKIISVNEIFTEDNENGEYYKLKDNKGYTKTAPVETEDGFTADKYEDYKADVETQTYKKYTKTEAKEVVINESKVSEQLTTGADGKLLFSGLAEGVYTIKEITAPNGYNLLKNPIVVTITCTLPDTADDSCTWSATVSSTGNEGSNAQEQTVTVNEDGLIAFDVINNTGSELPSTGGIGTTIFYIIGGILVVGAAILLVTKKRMSKEA